MRIVDHSGQFFNREQDLTTCDHRFHMTKNRGVGSSIQPLGTTFPNVFAPFTLRETSVIDFVQSMCKFVQKTHHNSLA